jgi:opacity protein-like surface antigen
VLFFLAINYCYCQAGFTEEWVKGYSYPIINQQPTHFKLFKDNSTNLYIVATNSSIDDYYPSQVFSLSKLDSMGNEQWTKSSNAVITGVVFDINDNIYVTGNYEGSLNIFGSPLTSKGEQDIYLAKLDPNGNLQWIKSLGGDENDQSGGIDMSQQQEIVMTGSCRRNPDFIDTVLTADSRSKPFLVRFNLNGDLERIKIWNTDLNYSADTNYSDVKFLEPRVTKNGDVYGLLKICYSVVYADSLTFYGPPGTGSYAFSIIKVDPSLNVSNFYDLGMDNQHRSWGLKLDKFDNPYLIQSSWSQYIGSGSNIMRFDTLLNFQRTLYAPMTTSYPSCNWHEKDLTSFCFNHDNEIVTCTNDLCSYYSASPYPQTTLAIQSIDTAGARRALKVYPLNNDQLVVVCDIVESSVSNSTYVLGYATDGYQFDTDSILPSSIFLSKYSQSLVGVSTIDNNANLIAYPNPSDGLFSLDFRHNDKVGIVIKNIMGEEVLNKYIEGVNIQLDLKDQPGGIYFLEITSGENKSTVKIIVQ